MFNVYHNPSNVSIGSTLLSGVTMIVTSRRGDDLRGGITLARPHEAAETAGELRFRWKGKPVSFPDISVGGYDATRDGEAATLPFIQDGSK